MTDRRSGPVLRAPSDVYNGRHRIGRLEPTVEGVKAYVVDEADDCELRLIGVAPTVEKAQQIIRDAHLEPAHCEAKSEVAK